MMYLELSLILLLDQVLPFPRTMHLQQVSDRSPTNLQRIPNSHLQSELPAGAHGDIGNRSEVVGCHQGALAGPSGAGHAPSPVPLRLRGGGR